MLKPDLRVKFLLTGHLGAMCSWVPPVRKIAEGILVATSTVNATTCGCAAVAFKDVCGWRAAGANAVRSQKRKSPCTSVPSHQPSHSNSVMGSELPSTCPLQGGMPHISVANKDACWNTGLACKKSTSSARYNSAYLSTSLTPGW